MDVGITLKKFAAELSFLFNLFFFFLFEKTP